MNSVEAKAFGDEVLAKCSQQGCVDIIEHLPTLRRYASVCTGVLELGVRDGFSTAAILAGRPGHLFSVDLNRCPNQEYLDTIADSLDVPFMFFQASSLDFRLSQPVDMLFVDTLHTRSQLDQELSRYYEKVNKYIILHDTETFGCTGEDGGEGLWSAVGLFCRSTPWKLLHHYLNNNGLTILTK